MQDITVDWQVIAVVDPDGGGQDFAYTVGLHDRNLPELHLWARPTHGHDPGADFRLSPTDCCHLLNRFAQQLIDGTLVVGQDAPVDMDAGAARAIFTANAPVPHAQTNANLAAADCQVMHLSWSLHRPAIGVAHAVGVDEQDVIDLLITRLDRLPGRSHVPGMDLPPPVDRFTPQAAYGPRHNLVCARARAIARLHPVTVVDYANTIVDHDLEDAGIDSRHMLGVLRSAARPAGLVEQVDQAMDLAQHVARRQARDPRALDTWRTMLDDHGADPWSDEEFSDALAHVLAHGYAVLLACDVLGPHAPTSAADRAERVWRAALEAGEPDLPWVIPHARAHG